MSRILNRLHTTNKRAIEERSTKDRSILAQNFAMQCIYERRINETNFCEKVIEYQRMENGTVFYKLQSIGWICVRNLRLFYREADDDNYV